MAQRPKGNRQIPTKGILEEAVYKLYRVIYRKNNRGRYALKKPAFRDSDRGRWKERGRWFRHDPQIAK